MPLVLANSLDPSEPPSFSSHNFSSTYFPDRAVELLGSQLVGSSPDTLPAFATTSSFQPPSPSTSYSTVVAETKAALPRDLKEKEASSKKDLDDAEPPPPYTEGSSPLDAFTYIMAAAGGAASIITQVQQGGPAPLNTLQATGVSAFKNIILCQRSLTAHR